MRGELEPAVRCFTRVLAARPDASPALVGLAKIHAARGELAEAAVLLESAAATHPDPLTLATRGDIAERMGEAAIAEDWWRRAEGLALHIGEEQSVYDRQLARFWADHDRRTADAVALARREIGSRQDILAADTLAWALFKNGEIAEAAVWSARARRLGTRDPALLYHGARIAWAAGDASGALALLDRALAQNPHFDPREAPVARALQRRLRSERAPGSQPDTASRRAPPRRADADAETLR
jgi:tetratricopeptide (TPR) repeat protein